MNFANRRPYRYRLARRTQTILSSFLGDKRCPPQRAESASATCCHEYFPIRFPVMRASNRCAPSIIITCSSTQVECYQGPCHMTISIVVQGALWEGNLAEVANNCAHWRRLFPDAEIILSISITDMVDTDALATAGIVPTKQASSNPWSRNALHIIDDVADAVVLARPAMPLPHLKDNSGMNHGNLQIAAAQAGLTRASKHRVLRVRNDMIFVDASFIDQYFEICSFPRRSIRAFKERVLIPSLFTLNPFGDERLPFHYSDWFHFGLTDDVKMYWDVPFIGLADAVHYKVRPHAPHSNEMERRFYTRIGVEQILGSNLARRQYPQATLDYHNDLRDADLSLLILANEFAVIDLSKSLLFFEKYQKFINSDLGDHICLSHDHWRRLATTGVEPRRIVSPQRSGQRQFEAAFKTATNSAPACAPTQRRSSKRLAEEQTQ